MKDKEIRKLTGSGTNLLLRIPKNVRESLNIGHGDYVLVYLENGKMIVEKLAKGRLSRRNKGNKCS